MTLFYGLIILTNSVLGITATILSKHRAASYYFGLTTVFAAVWTFSIYQFFWAQDSLMVFSKLFSCQLAFFSAGIGVLFLVLLLLHYPRELIRSKAIKLTIATPVSLFFLASFQGLFVSDVTSELGIIYGPGHVFFGAYIIAFLLFVIGVSIYGLKTSTSYMDRLRLKFLIYSFILPTAAVFLSNFIGPILGYSQTSSIGPAFLTIFLAMNGYAIMKHQLFDIDVIIRKSIQYFSLSVCVFMVFFIVVFLYAQIFSYHGNDPLMSIIVATSIFVFSFPYLKQFFDELTEKVFFQVKKDYADILKKFSYESKKRQNSNDFSTHLIEVINKAAKLRSIFLYLKSTEGNYVLKEASSKEKKKLDRSLPKHIGESLEQVEQLSFLDDLKLKINDPFILDLATKGIQIILPLRHRGRSLGYIFIGEKLAESGFKKEELSFFKSVSDYASIELENLFFYDKIERTVFRVQKLNQFFLKTSTNFDDASIITKTMTHIQDTFNYKPALVFLNSTEGMRMYSKVLTMTESKEKRAALFLKTFLEEVKTTKTQREPYFLSGKQKKKVWHLLDLPLKKETETDILFLPFYVGNQLIAGSFCITTHSQSKVPWELLKAFSQQVAIILKNAGLYQLTKNTNSYHEELLDNMISGAILFDQHLCIRNINKNALSYLESSEEESLGKSLHELCKTDSKFEQVQKTFDTKQTITDEFQIVREGRVLDLSITTGYIDGVGHEAVIVILSDLSSIKSLQSRSQQLNRLSSLGMMASGIADEIKGPLESIKEIVEKTPQKWKEASFRQEYKEAVVPQVEKIDSFCRALLELGKPKTPKFEEINLETILSEVKTLLTGETQNTNIKLRVSSSSKETLIADKGQILHLLLNLGSNAIQSLKNTSGTVDMSVQDGPNQTIKLIINDTGQGIDFENTKKIFDPFFSTKEQHLGLGLTIAERIILAHSGSIKVQSKKDQGTSISILIPSLSRRVRT